MVSSSSNGNKYWSHKTSANDSQEELRDRHDVIVKTTSVKVDSETVSGGSRESLSSTEYVPV